jgi:competence protein ComEA
MSNTSWWRRPQLLAAAACLLIGVVVLAGSLLTSPIAAPPPALNAELELSDPFLNAGPPIAESVSADAPLPDVIVYVSGAVARPDVYRLPADARVKDVVLAAGGLLAEADSEAVNLAAPLQDADHIRIPRRGEVAPAPAPPAAAHSSERRINLNTAGSAELEDLPGVGRTLAERIIARREEQGPYRSVEDLREVTGIGARLFEQIAPLVTVGGQ